MVYDVYGTARPTTEAGAVTRCKLIQWEEYINIILWRFYGKLCACANSVYQAVIFGLGTRLMHKTPGRSAFYPCTAFAGV